MRRNWLESKVASTLFFWSVVVCLTCFAFVLLIAVPWVREFLNTSAANNVFGWLFLGIVALTIPCSVTISCGMAIFSALKDRSSVGLKVLYLFLFLLTWPVGSIVYYFTAYRRFMRGKIDARLAER